MTRWSGEVVFQSDLRWISMGNLYPVHPAYLDPCDWPPNPQIPLIAALHLNKTAIEDDFFKGYSLTHKLPNGVTYKEVAERCASTVKNINWLDPLR